MNWNLNITSPKDAAKELKRHGFKFIRQTGDHAVYSNGNINIVIVNNKKKFSKYTWSHTLRDVYKTQLTQLT